MELKEKIYYGGIAILYARINGELKFLMAENSETKNIYFVSGAKEDSDASDLVAIKRELEEEIGPITNNLRLVSTSVKQEFVFGPKKKERAGHRGSYRVFLGDVTNIAEKISHTKELSGIVWLSWEDVLNRLTFLDVKEVFIRATENFK